MIAGIETGGTKVICAIAEDHAPQSIAALRRIPTTTPEQTTAEINAWLSATLGDSTLTSLGIAGFGPLVTTPGSPSWGWITATTKPGWTNVNLVGLIHASATTPTQVVTDVAGAALGEHTAGAGRGHGNVAYATFGTGVGVGVLVDGQPFSSAGELGHILVRRHPLDRFDGVCPFHGDCIEGLASGPAILQRWGANASSLSASAAAEAREIEAYYIAQLVAAVMYTLGSSRVIVGGGVLKTPHLLGAVRTQLDLVTGGSGAGHGREYIATDVVVRPALGDQSGVRGALELASRALTAR